MENKKVLNSMLGMLLVIMLTVISAVALLAIPRHKGDSATKVQEQQNNAILTGTDSIGKVGKTSAEYITEKGYISNPSWVAISKGSELKDYLLNQNNKNAYILNDIPDFQWKDHSMGANYRPFASFDAILREGLTLDGCGYTVTNNAPALMNSSGYTNPPDDKNYKDNFYDTEPKRDTQQYYNIPTTYPYLPVSSFMSVCYGTLQNFNYELATKMKTVYTGKNFHSAGTLVGVLDNGGKINNVSVKLVPNSMFGILADESYVQDGSENVTYVGGMVGVSFGTINGVEVTLSDSSSIYAHSQYSNSNGYVDAIAMAGGVVAKVAGGSLSNVTVNLLSTKSGRDASNIYTDTTGNGGTPFNINALVVGEQNTATTIDNVYVNVATNMSNASGGTRQTVNSAFVGIQFDRATLTNYYRTSNIAGTDVAYHTSLVPGQTRTYTAKNSISEKTFILDSVYEIQGMDNAGMIHLKSNANDKLIWAFGSMTLYDQHSTTSVKINARGLGAGVNNAVSMTFGTEKAGEALSLKFEKESFTYDGTARDAKLYDGDKVIISNNPIKYTGDKVNANSNGLTATLTLTADGIIAVDSENKIVYRGVAGWSKTANTIINPITVTLTSNNDLSGGANIYNSKFSVSGLTPGVYLFINGKQHNSNTIDLRETGEYIFSLANSNYAFAKDTVTSYAVVGKEITIDKQLTLANPQDGVSINDGILTLNKRTDTVRLMAVSELYGKKHLNITGGKSTTIEESTNSKLVAIVSVDHTVTNLTLIEGYITAPFDFTMSSYSAGTVTITSKGVNVTTKGTITIGEQLTYTVVCNNGYTFLGWTDEKNNNMYVSVDPVYMLTVGVNGTTLKAVFVATNTANTTRIVLLNIFGEEVGSFYDISEEAGFAKANKLHTLNSEFYNTFKGWEVSKTEGNNVYLVPLYAKSTVNVDVDINGVATPKVLNEKIELEANTIYLINGIKMSQANEWFVYANDNLSIVTVDDTAVSGADNSTMYYDAQNKILRMNFAVADAQFKTNANGDDAVDKIKITIAIKDRNDNIMEFERLVNYTAVSTSFAQVFVSIPSDMIKNAVGFTIKTEYGKNNTDWTPLQTFNPISL